MAKIAVFRDGTCYDCSCEHLVLPEGMDVERERQNRDEWYWQQYIPGYRAGNAPPYLSLMDWLKQRGARVPTNDEIEEFDG